MNKSTTTWIIVCAIGLALNSACYAQTKTNHPDTPKTTAVRPKPAPSGNKQPSAPKSGTSAASPKNKTEKPAPNRMPAKKPAAPVKPAATPTVASTAASDLYTKAIGVRAGETSGLTYKHFFTDIEAFEGILGIWPNAIGLTGLYEKHVPFGNVDGLNWYFGGGAHLSIGTGKLYYFQREGNRYYSYRRSYPGLAVGLDGLIGAEYKIPKAPLAISFDIKPFIEVNNGGVLYTSFDPGLGIKVTF